MRRMLGWCAAAALLALALGLTAAHVAPGPGSGAFVLAAAFALCAVPSPDPDRPHTTARKVVGVLLYLFIFAVLLALHWLLPHELCRIHLLAVLAMLLALFGLWKLLDAKLD